MDDGTAQLLISALIQSMATIWAIIFGLTRGLHEFLDMKKRQFKEDHPDGTIRGIGITGHKIDKSDLFMITAMNVTLFLSVLCGIFALVLFRTDFLMYLEIGFSLDSIALLVVYMALWIPNLNSSDI